MSIEFFGLFFSLWATLPKLGALHIFPPEIWIFEFIYLAWKRTLLLIECVRQNAFWNQFGTVLVHSKLCLDASALKFWAYGTFHRMWRWIMPHEPPWPPTLEFACDFLPQQRSLKRRERILCTCIQFLKPSQVFLQHFLQHFYKNLPTYLLLT